MASRRLLLHLWVPPSLFFIDAACLNPSLQMAASAMTETILPPEMLENLKVLPVLHQPSPTAHCVSIF